MRVASVSLKSWEPKQPPTTRVPRTRHSSLVRAATCYIHPMHTYACMRTHAHAHTAQTHAHAHAHVHTHTETHTHAHALTHAHAHAHAHRLYLSPYDVSPTYKDVHSKYSVRYFLNLVLVDEEDRRWVGKG